MAPTKLPPYFERYFDERFGEINRRIEDLKLHVNDEIKELRTMVEKNQSDIRKIWFAFMLLTPVYIKDSRDWMIGFLKQLIGL